VLALREDARVALLSKALDEAERACALLRDEVLTLGEEKANTETRLTAPASRVQLESVPTVYDKLASHLPLTDGSELSMRL
jgi:hypothetical protein